MRAGVWQMDHRLAIKPVPPLRLAADVAGLRVASFDTAPDSVRGAFEAACGEASWAWFSIVAQTTLAPDETAVIAWCGDDSTIAAMPLASRVDGRLRALTAPYTTRYAPLMANPKAALALGHALGCAVRGSLTIDAWEDTPVTAAFVAGLATGGLGCHRHHHFINRRARFTEAEAYLTQLPGALREIVRRREKRLERASRLDYAMLSTAAECSAAIVDYLGIYGASWKQPEPHPEFIPTLIRAGAAAGWLRLALLRIDGAPVAAQIWLVDGARATLFKLAHVETAREHAPGTLLTHWAIRRLARTAGTTEIDFGRGDDAYKAQWAPLAVERYGLTAAAPRSLHGAAIWLRHVALPKLRSARDRMR